MIGRSPWAQAWLKPTATIIVSLRETGENVCPTLDAKHILNAGLDAIGSRVPQGRLRSNPTTNPSAVPSGLVYQVGFYPTLKRRAIFVMSLQDKGTRRYAFSPTKQPYSSAKPSRAVRADGVQREKMWDMFKWGVELELLNERVRFRWTDPLCFCPQHYCSPTGISRNACLPI